MNVTILTTTYNRAKLLPNLYNSLLEQNNKNFVWLIIDDGSIDNTKEVVNEFIKQKKLNIEYIYKDNGGKHTALNIGIKNVKTFFTFIVDDDDRLLNNAIECIEKYKKEVIDNNLCGISFLKTYNDGEIVGSSFDRVPRIDNFLRVKSKRKIDGDKAEIWVTDILKKYPFPIFEGERFIGESVVWNKISLDYDMLFINEPIYHGDYLDNGLTKSGRLLRIKNPFGGMENSKTYFKTNKSSFKDKVKNMWLFICYGKFAKKGMKQIIKESNENIFCIVNIPFGLMLYLYWKRKYVK